MDTPPFYFASRLKTVEPGGFCDIWFPTGYWNRHGRGYEPQLPAGWRYEYPGVYGRGWSSWHRGWAWRIHVSRDATPGDYPIHFLDDGQVVSTLEPLIVTVKQPVATRPVVRLERATAAEMQARLDAGNDLELAAFDYVIDGVIRPPDGARIFSSGAARLVLTKTASGGPEPHRIMFTPAGRFTLERVILTHDDTLTLSNAWFLHKWPTDDSVNAPNVTISGCTLESGMLGWATLQDMLVQGCKFTGGVTNAPWNAIYDHCEFSGRQPDLTHTFSATAANGLFLTNNRFRGTSRGFVFQSGDCVGVCGLDSYFDGIRGGSGNANECILFEAGTGTPIPCDDTHGSRHCMFLDVWINDCAGPGISLYGSGMHDMQFNNVDSHTDNTSLLVSALNGGEIKDIHLGNWQCTGAADLRGKAKVAFANVQWIQRPQRRGNQGPFTPNMQHFNNHFPFYADDVAKHQGEFMFQGCGIVGFDLKYREVRGIAH